MKFMKLGFLLLVAMLLQASEIGPRYIPNSATAVTTSTVRIHRIHLSNGTGSAATVTLADRSTNCNSGTCPIWPTVSIAANTVYTVDLGGVLAVNGFTWESGTANAVMGWVTYSTSSCAAPDQNCPR